MKLIKTITDCPCGSGSDFNDCCEPYLNRTLAPSTAEKLMRSRYSAFALANRDYLIKTWYPDTRPLDIQFAEDISWVKLEILHITGGTEFDSYGEIEFDATYIIGIDPTIHIHHERSVFRRQNGRWFYDDEIE
ncbi:YchJ family protein [Corynebacterium kutscheri]|uniref:YchJ family protein n=1 Tax=Corynebacterium kutscheri TaxID=35755 RepID=UPI0037C015EB